MWHFIKLLHHEIEDKSECSKRKVAAIIFDNDPNISVTRQYISWGVNKPVLNQICGDSIISDHRKFSDTFEIHAEINAINNALKKNVDLSKYSNLSILVTCSPCNACLKSLIDLGIKNVFYYEEYDKSKELLEYSRKFINIKKVER